MASLEERRRRRKVYFERRARWTRHIIGREESSEFYDTHYTIDQSNSDATYSRQPCETSYYPSWKQVLVWIKDDERIADFGCGPGQFAQLALETGKRYVLGVDFSRVAVEWAQRRNPSIASRFFVGDILSEKVHALEDYDVAVFLETLEHIHEDLEALRLVPRGRRVILTVPSFSLEVHVRFFRTMKEVIRRYRSVLEITRTAFVDLSVYRRLWLVEGIRSDS